VEEYDMLGMQRPVSLSEFRVGGRFCNTCKDAGIHSTLAEVFASKGAVAYGDSLDAENSAESEDTP